MNSRAIRAVAITVLVLFFAAVFWPSWQSGPDVVEETSNEPEQTTRSGPAESSPPQRDNERQDWFPDLTESQPTGTVAGSGAGGGRFDCSLQDFMQELEDEDVRRERDRFLADTLSRSAYAEDQLAAALIRGSAELGPRIDNLQQALAADGNHPLVLWQVADDCRRGRGGEYCSDPSVRASVEAVLGGNGWYWMQVAAFYHEQGMFDESLGAVQRAAAAPEFNDYWIEYVLLMERSFAVDSDRSYLDRVVAAMGVAAAMPADFLARECPDRAALDDRWLDSCTMIAERYEQDGTNLLMKMVGLGMQDRLYTRSGLAAEAADARTRKDELAALLPRVDADYQLVQALDPQVMSRYLDVWASSGEVAAFEYSISAVDRLLEDPDYDPCVFLPTE